MDCEVVERKNNDKCNAGMVLEERKQIWLGDGSSCAATRTSTLSLRVGWHCVTNLQRVTMSCLSRRFQG